MPLFSDAECSFAHAEVLEDVVKGFLGSDLTSCDFRKNAEGLSKIFWKKVAAQIILQAFNDGQDAFMSSNEWVVVTRIGHDDIIFGKWGDVGCSIDGLP